jgi:DNA (cytosine-5)-methyltransferase 1
MRGRNAGEVQGRLFGSGAVERFQFDEATSMIRRVITPSDPDGSPYVSEIGMWDGRTPLDDLRAIADLTYLQRREAPASSNGPEVRCVDLFSGCGAMSLGLSEACRAVGRKFVPVGAFDIERRFLDVYEANFGAGTGHGLDLSTVLLDGLTDAPTELERELVATIGRVDFVVAGPPCQGHSNLNNKTRRNDPKNALYFLVARFAKLFRPECLVIENVVAVTADKGGVVPRTVAALESLGYETTTGIVDLWSLGVAQTRRRHVLVATLRRRASPLYLDDLIAPYMTRVRPLRWAVGDLLAASAPTYMDQTRVPDSITQSRIDYLFDHDLYDLPKSQRPPSHKGQHGDSYKAVYGRMRWDEPSPTLTGGFLTMGQGRFVHPKRRRTITPHEAARIQFIPDFYDFSPAAQFRTTLCETIGNAVPPKLSYVLGVELLR